MNWIKKFFASFLHRESALKTELRNLEAVINKDERVLSKLSNEFWRNGGVCCPSCGVPGYSALCTKQERREVRADQLRKKLFRDSLNGVQNPEPQKL